MPVVTQMSNLDLLTALVGENVADNLLQENQGSLYQLPVSTTGFVSQRQPRRGVGSACGSMPRVNWSSVAWKKVYGSGIRCPRPRLFVIIFALLCHLSAMRSLWCCFWIRRTG